MDWEEVENISGLIGKDPDVFSSCVDIIIEKYSSQHSKEDIIKWIKEWSSTYIAERGKYIAEILSNWKFKERLINSHPRRGFIFVNHPEGVNFYMMRDHCVLIFPDDIKMKFDDDWNGISFEVPYIPRKKREEGTAFRKLKWDDIFSETRLDRLFDDPDTQYSRSLLLKRLKTSKKLFERWEGKKVIDVTKDMFSFSVMFAVQEIMYNEDDVEGFGEISRLSHKELYKILGNRI